MAPALSTSPVGGEAAGHRDIAIADSADDDLGSFRFASEIDAVISALADGSLDVQGIVTHIVPAHRAVEAFGTAADASRSSKVLLSFDDGGIA